MTLSAPWFIRIDHEQGQWSHWPQPNRPQTHAGGLMPKQLEIAGTEAPKNEDIEKSIDMWLDAKEEQKRSTETTKLRHSALLLHMQEAKIDVYPFTCPRTGKKRQVVIARDPKAKTLKAPRWNRRDGEGEIAGDELEVKDADEAPDNVVEMRRVKRTAAHDAIVDPFAATRGAMDEDDEPPFVPIDELAEDSDAPAETQTNAPPKKRGKKAK